MVERARAGTDRVLGWVERIPAGVMLGVALLALAGTVAALAIAIPLSNRVANQAKAGAAARDRSCKLLPASQKLYADAFDRGIVSADDVALFESTAAQVCGPGRTK